MLSWRQPSREAVQSANLMEQKLMLLFSGDAELIQALQPGFKSPEQLIAYPG